MSYRQKRGRNTTWRTHLSRNLLSELIVHEKLTLEVERAKDLRKEFDKMVTLAKKQTVSARRRADAKLFPVKTKDGKTVVQKLFDDIAKRYPERNSGYTSVIRLGTRRGDNAEVAVISLV